MKCVVMEIRGARLLVELPDGQTGEIDANDFAPCFMIGALKTPNASVTERGAEWVRQKIDRAKEPSAVVQGVEPLLAKLPCNDGLAGCSLRIPAELKGIV